MVNFSPSVWCTQGLLFIWPALNDNSSPTCPVLGGALGWNFLFSEGSQGLPQQAGSPALPILGVPGQTCRLSRLTGLVPSRSRSGLAGCES